MIWLSIEEYDSIEQALINQGAAVIERNILREIHYPPAEPIPDRLTNLERGLWFGAGVLTTVAVVALAAWGWGKIGASFQGELSPVR